MNNNEILVQKVVGLAIKVHSTLGPGFLESVNQNALVIELRRNSLEVEVGRRIIVWYEGEAVGEFVADLVVTDPSTGAKLLIEIKSVSALLRAHSVQLVNYLSATGFEHGLLRNFGGPRIEFKTKTRTYRNSEPPPDLQT